MSQPKYTIDKHQLAEQIKNWSSELGFQQLGITNTSLETAEAHLFEWLDDGMHGDMDYMQKHGTKRSRPEELVCRRIFLVLCPEVDDQAQGQEKGHDATDNPERHMSSKIGTDFIVAPLMASVNYNEPPAPSSLRGACGVRGSS